MEQSATEQSDCISISKAGSNIFVLLLQDNVYGAVIMAEPLREFTRFI